MGRETTGGLPEDELYVYKDALRQGRSVVFVQARDAVEATRARKVLDEADAESIDAARDKWWIGLRCGRGVRSCASRREMQSRPRAPARFWTKRTPKASMPRATNGGSDCAPPRRRI